MLYFIEEKILIEYCLQVSYFLYIFEVCLFGEVEDIKSKVIFGSGVVKF